MVRDPDFFKDLIENLYDGIYFVDLDRTITYWNSGAESITGYSAAQVVGKHCRDNILNHVLANGVQLCQEHCPMAATIKDGKRREAEVFLHHADGHRVPVLVRASPIYNDQGKIIGAVETFSDNTTQILTRRKNEQLQESVLKDPLTGIGNRRQIEMRLKAELVMFAESGNSFGLIFIDIDHFKAVNDSYGHPRGDKVLRMVANTLRLNLREADIIGRWGGEEFIIVVSQVNVTELEGVANKLRFLVSQSRIDDEQGSISVTISLGATLAIPGDTSDSVVARADSFMYQSKNNGRDQVTIG